MVSVLLVPLSCVNYLRRHNSVGWLHLQTKTFWSGIFFWVHCEGIICWALSYKFSKLFAGHYLTSLPSASLRLNPSTKRLHPFHRWLHRGASTEFETDHLSACYLSSHWLCQFKIANCSSWSSNIHGFRIVVIPACVFSDILQTINLLPGDGTFCFIPNLFCILSNFMQAMRFLIFRFCSPNNSIYFRR